MIDHAPLPPSDSFRWGNCAGSAVLQPRFPQLEHTPEQLEGEAAHDVAAVMLRDLVQFGQARKFQAGHTAPNGVILNDEIIECATVYVDAVVEALGEGNFDKLHIEERVDIPSVHPDNWGTPDVWWAVINPGIGAYVHVWDAKFGYKFVDDFENYQLCDYGWGIIGRPEFEGIPLTNIQFTFGICQPRNYHVVGPVRTWEVTADKIQPIIIKLAVAAQQARNGNALTHPGPWCTFCTARRACQALQLAADGAMDIACSPTPVDLPPGALGTELVFMERAFQLLEARLTGLREQAYGLITKGETVPGFELERGNAREQWARTPDEVFALGSMFGIDLRQTKPITPEQARKAGITKELVAAYSTRPPGSLKLQPSSNTLARKVFGKW